jgi:hypothetical protein
MYANPSPFLRSTFLSGVELRLATNGQSSRVWEPCFLPGSLETLVSLTPVRWLVLILEYLTVSYEALGHHDTPRQFSFSSG